MGYKRITETQKRTYWAAIKAGMTNVDASRRAGFHEQTGKALLKGVRSMDSRTQRAYRADDADPGPIPLDQLNPEAKLALDDIAYFALRYFGFIVLPWQQEATARIVALQTTPEEEYAVINCPPGSGKSTFFTLVLPAWITCRNRAIRGLIGSASQNTAKWYLQRLKTFLSITHPAQGKASDLALGIAQDAVATLVEDFGSFKPKTDERWASDAFTVRQHGDRPVSEKENTWMAFGRSSTFLGARVDFCIWDDVYDPTQLRTDDAKELLRQWWDGNCETRLEPGGLLILQGQRKDAADIYRYALDKKAWLDDDAEDGDDIDEDARKYRHITFKAHYEDRCVGDHGRNATPYPEGCLLYPRRLSYRKLMGIKVDNNATYEIEYQQEDSAASDVLIQKAWANGGVDVQTGSTHFGCWDNDRGICELPKNLRGPLYSIATIDPSPTRWWGIHWYIYAPNSHHQVFLMDLVRAKLRGNEVLDWLENDGKFVGVMQDWQERSVAKGYPISHWIIEANAAQAWFYSDDKGRRWLREHGTSIVEHVTTGRKNDPDYGVYMLREPWRSGRIRLPGAADSRHLSLKLVDEVTRYPHGGTDDQVMAQWFLFAHLERLAVTASSEPNLARPSWIRSVPDARRIMAV